MSPRTREETEQLLIDAINALDDLDDKTKTELLESSGWIHLIISRSRKGEVWMTKNGFGQLEQVFDRVSHHARQTA